MCPSGANDVTKTRQGDIVEEKCSLIWKKENFNILIAHDCLLDVRGREQGCGGRLDQEREAPSNEL